MIAGYVVMAALAIGLGLIITKWLAGGPVGTWEDSVNRWFVDQRTTTLDSVSRVGSDLGASLTIIGIAVVAGIVLAIGRHWRELGFLVAALTLESSVSLTSSIIVNRARPNVPRLDAAPPTASFPSGHTAAAIVLFVSLAIVITAYVRNAAVRVLVYHDMEGLAGQDGRVLHEAGAPGRALVLAPAQDGKRIRKRRVLQDLGHQSSAPVVVVDRCCAA